MFIWTRKNINLNKKRGNGRIFFWLVSLLVDRDSVNSAEGEMFHELETRKDDDKISGVIQTK